MTPKEKAEELQHALDTNDALEKIQKNMG